MDHPPPFGFDYDSSTLVVVGVKPGGQAEKAGVKAGCGWKLHEFNGTSIKDSSHYKALAAEAKPKEGSDANYTPVRLTFQVGAGAEAKAKAKKHAKAPSVTRRCVCVCACVGVVAVVVVVIVVFVCCARSQFGGTVGGLRV